MSGAWRMVLGVGFAVLLAALGLTTFWRLVVDTMRRIDPSTAIAWDPNDQRALEGFSRGLFAGSPTAEDIAAAEGIASRALTLSPLRSGAARILGQVAERRGDDAQARALINIAADRWIYDLDAQIWLINSDLRAGNTEVALRHADEILRTRPGLWEEVLPGLVPLALGKDLNPLVDLLATSPSWRTRFLEILCLNSASMQPLSLYAALADRSAGPTDPEMSALLRQMVGAGQYREAYLAWVKFLPSERLASLSNVYDGGFDLPASGVAFDWSFVRIAGATIEVKGRPDDAANPALHVEFSGRRTPFKNVSQMLLLSPGRYGLKVSGMAQGLQNERGMWWRLSCADGRPLADTDRLSGTTEWKEMRSDFVVPEEGCMAQRLQLELAARAVLEEEVSGEVWFDDVSVSPKPAESGS